MAKMTQVTEEPTEVIQQEVTNQRIEIPRDDIIVYKNIVLGFSKVPVKIRQLRFKEITQLNNFNEDHIDEIFDAIVLSSTDLTQDALLAMPRIDRYYLLLYLRSISFIDARFTLELPCESEECTRKREHKVGIEEFNFVPVPEEFFTEKNFTVGDINYTYKYRLDTYNDEKNLENINLEDDSERVIANIVPNIEYVKINGVLKYSYRGDTIGYAEGLKFLDENGILFQYLYDEVYSYTYGVQEVEVDWVCKCKHKNKTVINPDVFFFPAEI